MSTVAQAAFLFLPEEALVLVISAAGMAMIVGAKRLSMSLLTFAGAAAILPVLLYPLIQMVPIWILWVGAVYLFLLLPYYGLSLLANLVSPALGKRSTDTMVGNMASTMSIRILAAPFRLAGAVCRLIIRLVRAIWG